MPHLISIHDLSKAELLSYLDLAEHIHNQPPTQELLKNKLISLAFFEPSTRTRLSFEAAALRLGAKVMGVSEAQNTSTAKGETLSDTARVLGGYSDALIIRHPQEGAARLAAEYAGIPVINAGDGANQHPSQTLLDLFTLRQAFGKLEKLNLAVMGDLKNARTIHSLIEAASFFDMRIYGIPSHENLSLPTDLIEILKRRGVKFSFHHPKDLEFLMPKLDVLYLSRLQKERLEKSQLQHYAGQYSGITLKILKNAQPHFKILHPLPRQQELPPEIDHTPHALYFEQAKNGVIVRQAILLKALGISLPLQSPSHHEFLKNLEHFGVSHA